MKNLFKRKKEKKFVSIHYEDKDYDINLNKIDYIVCNKGVISICFGSYWLQFDVSGQAEREIKHKLGIE